VFSHVLNSAKNPMGVLGGSLTLQAIGAAGGATLIRDRLLAHLLPATTPAPARPDRDLSFVALLEHRLLRHNAAFKSRNLLIAAPRSRRSIVGARRIRSRNSPACRASPAGARRLTGELSRLLGSESEQPELA